MKQLICILALAVAIPVAAQVPKRELPGIPTAVRGTVDGVIANADTIVMLTSTTGDRWHVNAGPTAYLQGLGLELAPGMRISVDGFEMRPAVRPTILARRIYVGDRAYSIREMDGSLVWLRFVNDEPMRRVAPPPLPDPPTDRARDEMAEQTDEFWRDDVEDLGGGVISYGGGSVIELPSGALILGNRFGSPFVSPGIRRFIVGPPRFWWF